MEQEEDAPAPARTQSAGEKVPGLVPLNDTVPVGVTLVPDEVSVTVAVQTEDEPTLTEEGEQLRMAEVLRVRLETTRV